MTQSKKIAIVGAGITGLTAAFYLQKVIKEQGLPYELEVFEASHRLGGKIQTMQKDGMLIERGPDSFLCRKEPGVRLANHLGLNDELVRNDTGQSYILIEDTLHKMPQGSFMGLPTSLQALQDNTLVSETGKKRAALDLDLPPSEETGDQSLGYFLRRRFGDEWVENVIEPLLSGIYAGDIDNMSLQATFPNFYELEQTYGSIIKGLQQTHRKKPQTGKTPGQFFSFKNGLETFIDQLEKAIDKDVISLNQEVKEITPHEGGYQLQFSPAETVTADVVIMTTPHHVLPKVFPTQDAFQSLSEVPSTSVATVALAYDESAIEQDLDGTGFVVSRNSPYHFTACTWTHKKWKHTAPEGKALLRAYVGKPTDQEIVTLSDEKIMEIVLQDIRHTMSITAKPNFSIVTRWNESMPQYTVGHRDRIQNIHQQLEKHLPGVFIAGSSFEGVGIPDCIGQAEKMAELAVDYLKEKSFS